MRLPEQSGCKSPANRRRGIAFVWTALLLMVFTGFVGLAIDWGYVVLVAHQLQNTADAAALAGSQFVKFDQVQARTAAVDFGAANRAAESAVQLDRNDDNVADGDIVLGRYDRDDGTFTPTLFAPNAVKVVARRTDGSLNGPLPLLFGPIFGYADTDVARYAIAMSGGGTGAGLVVLHPTDSCALKLEGEAHLTVNDGDIQVNSGNSTAACAEGTPIIEAPEMNVVGGVSFSGGSTLTGDLNLGVDPIPDPLEFLPEPSTDGLPDHGSVWLDGNETMTIDPGYYPGGIVQENGDLTFNPGIYIVEGNGLQYRGGIFSAPGVMFFVKAGPLYLAGSGSLTLTPPDPGLYSYPGVATYEYVSIFQSRSNTTMATIVGSSGMSAEGTIYLPSNHVDLGGSGGELGTQMIASSLGMRGKGTITINYNGLEPAPGLKSYLVR